MNDDGIEDPKKIFRILDGGKVEATTPGAGQDESIPQHDYMIVDIWDTEHYATGFLLFTSQHVAVMQEQDNGALPIIVFPLGNVKFAELVEDTEATVELPF